MEEYTIAKQAKIMPSSPTFEYNEQFASKLCTVTEALAKDIYETVDLKVKVLTKEEKKQPIIQNKKVRYKCDTVIGDNTNSMKLILWKNIIDDIHAGKSYHFMNSKVRVFEDEKFFNTNDLTEYEEIEDLKDINLSSTKVQEHLLKGQCTAVQLKRNTSCIVCNMTIHKETAHDEMITCTSCGNTTLQSKSKTKLIAPITILTEDGKMMKFTSFNDGLKSLMNTSDCTTPSNNIDLDDLKKITLKSGLRQIIADKATQIISQFLSE